MRVQIKNKAFAYRGTIEDYNYLQFRTGRKNQNVSMKPNHNIVLSLFFLLFLMDGLGLMDFFYNASLAIRLIYCKISPDLRKTVMFIYKIVFNM